MSIGDEVINGIKETADTVTRAVESGDYSRLSDDITKTIEETSKRVREETAKAVMGDNYQNNYQKNNPNSSSYSSPYVNNKWYSDIKKSFHTNTTADYVANKKAQEEKLKSLSPFQTQSISRWMGTGETLVGGFLSISFGASFFICLVIMLLSGEIGMLGAVIPTLVFTILGIYFWRRGAKSKNLSDKFHLFKRFAGDSEYISIKDFANKLQMPQKDVLNTFKELMRRGMLLGARLDDEETTVILTEHAYDEYLKYQTAKKIQNANVSKSTQEEKSNSFSNEEKSTYSDEVSDLLSEGKNYLVRVREINDKISDDDIMSDKLYKLEEIMKKIFDQVQKDPEKAPELRKFMNYYLPTTEKLINSYAELNVQPQGETVVKTKNQISNAMDTINSAFEKLLDDMFKEQAMDIMSDISVMNTMFAQDGLVGDKMQMPR